MINSRVSPDPNNRRDGENPPVLLLGGQPERPGNSFLDCLLFLPGPSGETQMRLPLAIAAAFAAVALAGPAVAGPAEDIIAKEKCSKCHTATTTKKAPSWASVAEKYKGKPEAEAKILNMLKTGGAEDHNKIAGSDADLKAVIAIVMSSK